jgi:hypothetical protein
MEVALLPGIFLLLSTILFFLRLRLVFLRLSLFFLPFVLSVGAIGHNVIDMLSLISTVDVIMM